jgi:hypothetical protein
MSYTKMEMEKKTVKRQKLAEEKGNVNAPDSRISERIVPYNTVLFKYF